MDYKELRTKATAAFASAVAFAKERGIENADDATNGQIAAADWETFNRMMDNARKLDWAFAVASRNAGNVTTAQERMDFYSRAVTGQGMHFSQLAQAEPVKTLGQQFAESDEYRELLESGALQSERTSFKMAPVVNKFAATDIIATGGTDPAAGLLTPMLIPGILPLPQRDLTVRGLFSQRPMTMGDTIEYAAQVAFDNAAAAVVEAAADGNPTGAKPQSSIAWERRTSPAEQIATWMAVTRKTLQDASVVQGIIDNQGRLMLQLEEEDQLLNGNGTPPNLRGLFATPGVITFDLTGEDNLDGVRAAKRLVKTGTSRLNADAIVLNPEDSEGFDLLKDGEERYRGGDPFGLYPDANPIWRLRRVESEAVAQGTAIVGAFNAGATVMERQPVTVFTSDSHADFFIRNLVVVLFEERLAFPVWFPTAFVKVTLADFTEAVSGDIGAIS